MLISAARDLQCQTRSSDTPGSGRMSSWGEDCIAIMHSRALAPTGSPPLRAKVAGSECIAAGEGFSPRRLCLKVGNYGSSAQSQRLADLLFPVIVAHQLEWLHT